MTFFSCSGRNQLPSDKHIPPQAPKLNTKYQQPSFPKNNLSNQRKIIVSHTIKNIGRPYQWGGTSPATGFDCSGLIFYTHQKVGLNMPRTATALFKAGKPISKQHLNPADLVFFKNPNANKTLHVGIYIGDDMFVHAPGKNRPVTTASLNNPYFRRYYLGSRRYL